jgi:hypothetical protein
MAARLQQGVIEEIVALIPDAWLMAGDRMTDAARTRAAYARYLLERLAAPRAFVGEAAGVR